MRLCLAAAAFVVAVPATALAQSYPLTCRGGGSLSITNYDGSWVVVRFVAGVGAATAGLQPGQCTWSDRAMHADEPKAFCDNAARARGYVARLIDPDAYTILQVHNAGSCMNVDRVGP
jgi:hypothetical protein